jgi:hypothetical protein
MRIVARTERFIFAAPAWQLITALLLIMLVKTGVWCIPNLDKSRLIAQDPFLNPFSDPYLQTLYWNWLGPFLAYLLGAKGRWSFFALHLLFSAGFTALFIRTAFRHLSDRAARVSLILFAALPVSATAYFWVGPDSLTLLLMMAALAAAGRQQQHKAVPPLLGVALGLQHFEQAVLGFAGLLLALIIRHRQRGDLCTYDRLRWVLALLTGILIGKLVLMAMFHLLDAGVSYGRLQWLIEHHRILLEKFLLHTGQILWSSLGLGWLVLLKQVDEEPACAYFLVPLSLLMLLLVISGDQTRVFAITSFPLLCTFWLLESDGPLARLSDRFVAWLFLGWLVVPWSWVWAGEPKWSVFPYDILYLLNLWLGWFTLPANPALWPFLAQ